MLQSSVIVIFFVPSFLYFVNAAKNERRESFLQKFYNGNEADYNQFNYVQQRLTRHHKKFAKMHPKITSNKVFGRKQIQEINKADKDGENGDILLTKEQADVLLGDGDIDNNIRNRRQAQTGIYFPMNLWPIDQHIPYRFGSLISEPTSELIRLAIKFWEDNTCLTFAENGTGNNSLYFEQDSGCYSYIGRVYDSLVQTVSIGEGCELFGIIAHEIGHALGFFHTQSRHDRDNYVFIQNENIPDEFAGQYNKESQANNDNYDVEYDYGSVMHYAQSTGYTDSPVEIIAKQKKYQRTMGNRIKPSFDDILLMNRYYGCIDKCTIGASCLNGGFRNSKNCSTCICPSGFGGETCEKRADPENGATNCGATLTATPNLQTLTGQVGVNTKTKLQRAMGCHWHIVAPPGQFVKIRVTSVNGLCTQGCTAGGTEIKHQSYTLTGTRLCCSTDPRSTGTLTTTTNLAVVSAYSYYNTQEFVLDYTATSTNESLELSSFSSGKYSHFTLLGSIFMFVLIFL